ncbi:MAG: hypothetical protein C4520_15620 [Candidatus Abyssobacteria bacterium SURF_5]|uniref:Glycosyltransferase RgtA/B/C/D-like domain-containing protein n=1 Tax=Abyssobacteria bacterium (strain SURF_5) TaxID=2093360 RepID=A0A3A4N9E9_ABYX5|nr:MAG: hypothetical protein C4520_15620 [Candidatus Abyssubacteria bacterium SURF_5]
MGGRIKRLSAEEAAISILPVLQDQRDITRDVDKAPASVVRVLKHILLLFSPAYIGLYLIIALCRIRYPFQLEWMEGGVLEHVRRILSGEQLYVRPSLDFITFLYTPFYYYLSAAVSKATGFGFFPLRLVSLLSSLASLLFIFLIVKRETASRFAAALAAGLFAATFHISGAWFDIGRVDMLFVALLLPCIYLIRFKESAYSLMLAGLLVSLSFLTKQLALFISLPMAVYCLLVHRTRSLYFIGAVAGVFGISTVLFTYLNDGWYLYYIFSSPRRLETLKNMLTYYWTHDLFFALPIACFLSLWYLVKRDIRSPKHRFFYTAIGIGMIGVPWLSRFKHGSYLNVPMPAYAFISILFGIAIHDLFQWCSTLSRKRKTFAEITTCCALLAQFSILMYDPFPQIPGKNDLAAGRKIVDTLAQMEGEVFIPYHGYLASLAGKRSYAHAMAVDDFLRTTGEPEIAQFVCETEQALREGAFSAVILDSDPLMTGWLRERLQHYAVATRPVFEDDSVFWPVTGLRTRPQLIYMLR